MVTVNSSATVIICSDVSPFTRPIHLNTAVCWTETLMRPRGWQMWDGRLSQWQDKRICFGAKDKADSRWQLRWHWWDLVTGWGVCRYLWCHPVSVLLLLSLKWRSNMMSLPRYWINTFFKNLHNIFLKPLRKASASLLVTAGYFFFLGLFIPLTVVLFTPSYILIWFSLALWANNKQRKRKTLANEGKWQMRQTKPTFSVVFADENK